MRPGLIGDRGANSLHEVGMAIAVPFHGAIVVSHQIRAIGCVAEIVMSHIHTLLAGTDVDLVVHLAVQPSTRLNMAHTANRLATHLLLTHCPNMGLVNMARIRLARRTNRLNSENVSHVIHVRARWTIIKVIKINFDII